MKNVNKIESALNYREDLACNLKIYKEMKSFLFIPDELYVYNDNLEGLTHSKDADILKKKVEDTIYVYYELYKSVKDFNIKDKKYYKKIISYILLIDLLSLPIKETGPLLTAALFLL